MTHLTSKPMQYPPDSFKVVGSLDSQGLLRKERSFQGRDQEMSLLHGRAVSEISLVGRIKI